MSSQMICFNHVLSSSKIVSRSRAAREVQLVQILPHSPAAGKQINYNKYLKTSVLMQSSKMKLNLSSTLLLPWLLVFLTSIQMEEVSSAKILTISFMSSKSHRITYEPLLRELARRGHEVTAIGPILSKDEKNFKNIQTINQEKSFSKGTNFFDLKLNMPAWLEGFFNAYLFLGHRLVGMCHDSYNLPQVQKVLNETWDMVFFTPLLNECLYGLVYKLNTTTVIYTQTTVFTWLADNLGTPNPPSHVSSILIGYDERMNFGQRFFNVFRSVYDWAILNLYYFPMAQSAYRTLLGDPTIPSIQEIERNASIVLMNSHISFSPPRPLLPDIIEVGGMHLIPSKPVQPKELDDFLSGGKDGFILFSMGSTLKGSMMPEKYRKIFLNTFSKLKQRVIWKWETEEMEGLPPNVKLSKWLPQQDVLGHKNIRLFITHGGHGSTTEAIFHGVPLVGIPMLGDQGSNMLKASRKGFALPPLEFADLTEEILLNAINEAINNPGYREKARELSKIFLDQQTKPLDRAVYWIEYVLRHKGAVHLRSAARDLSYIQYFSLDTLAVLLIILAACITINVLTVRAIYRKCFGSRLTKTENSLKKKQ